MAVGTDKTRTVFTIKKEDKDKVMRIANEEGIHFSELINKALLEYIKKYEESH